MAIYNVSKARNEQGIFLMSMRYPFIYYRILFDIKINETNTSGSPDHESLG